MYTPGMRTLKTAAAVFICLFIGFFRGGSGMPFYSAIAAVLCMQPDVSGSAKVAWQRALATFIGGLAGMGLIMLERAIMPNIHTLPHYMLVSLAIIPLIWVTVLIKKTDVTYVTCVVFLSIVVAHGFEATPAFFAINRILDTLIGIFVSLIINLVHLQTYRNLNVLFVSDMDGTLLNSRGRVSAFSRFLLNHAVSGGAKFTVASARTPATLVPALEGIDMRIPVIAMGGAVTYDIKSGKYLSAKVIPRPVARQVLGVFSENGRGCFTHIIRDNHLYVYYNRFQNKVEEEFYKQRMDLPLKTYVRQEPSLDDNMLSFTAIDMRDSLERLCRAVLAMPCADELSAVMYSEGNHEGYYVLDIFRHDATKENAVRELRLSERALKLVSFGDDVNDLGMLKSSDFGFAVKNANPEILNAAEHVTKSDNNHDTVARSVVYLFSSRTFFAEKPKADKPQPEAVKPS